MGYLARANNRHPCRLHRFLLEAPRQIARMPLLLRRTHELGSRPRDSLTIVWVLVLSVAQLRFPLLRADYAIGDRRRRRVLYLRSNGGDAFTFFEVFVNQAYRNCLPQPMGPAFSISAPTSA